jgi:hypothetical protein
MSWPSAMRDSTRGPESRSAATLRYGRSHSLDAADLPGIFTDTSSG